MFYITYSDSDGDCMVSYDNEPTWCLDNAMKFNDWAEANDWLSSPQAKEWLNLGCGGNFTICEMDNED